MDQKSGMQCLSMCNRYNSGTQLDLRRGAQVEHFFSGEP